MPTSPSSSAPVQVLPVRPIGRCEQILSGIKEQNSPAVFEGRSGFWVQGDCVFVEDAKSPQSAIHEYRARIAVGRVAVNHNFGAHGIREAKLLFGKPDC